MHTVVLSRQSFTSLLSVLQTATPRGKLAAANISPKSKPDYTIYALKAKDRIVALVIEAKCLKTSQTIKHSSAQVCCMFNIV